jgi:hypothetical protein
LFDGAALAAYVATFLVAGNGCWFDVAAAVGGCAVAGWAVLAGLGAASGRGVGVCARAAVPAAWLLVAVAGLNLAVFAFTGIGTFTARLAALLFVPFHIGVLAAADLLLGIALVRSWRAAGGSPRVAAVGWLVAFNGTACATFVLLRQAGVV